MEPENFKEEISDDVVLDKLAPLKCVTPLSKYLAMTLFVVLPFIGGAIGYSYAPDKVVEIEKIVVKEVEKVVVQEVETIDFPVVAYNPAGLFEGAEGLIQKEYLEKQFVNPYVDYYKDNLDSAKPPLTVTIKIPKNIGDRYTISTVQIVDGVDDPQAGGFLFGNRGEEYTVWTPSCFTGCDLTESYKAKYPEVVKQMQIQNQP